VSGALETAPRVSVITAVHNAGAFLEPTLRSLLAQSFKDFESLVIDDGSTDDSTAIVERLAAGDRRIRLFRQPTAGVAETLNRGLRESRGQYIAFLDHDDIWHPDKLARQVEVLDADQAVGMVGCYSALLDEQFRCLGWRFGTAARGKVYRQMVFCDLVAGGSAALVRREAFTDAGAFDTSPEIEGRSDWDQWLRISRHWDYATVEAPLVGYTRRATNYSRDYWRMLAAGEVVLAKAAASDPDLRPGIINRALARDAFGIFCLCVADRDFDEAQRVLRRSLSRSWRPVMLSPKRWGVILVYLVARVAPRAVYDRLLAVVTPMAMQLTPGTPFIADPGTPG
jgi:glycosyltransferase involved in cell wall biosynthesis